ncbi:tetratricopeptide repeat protein, partial [Calothrix rhizosoleniae]|uniref:tetratricopeptide repeat protein n=1 Tax=Calothrix rhizosoleniae TaxID=888997 RepID=UPI001177C0F8
MNEDFYKQGLEKAQQKDFVAAIELFNRALQTNPNWDAVYYRRGLAYFDTGAIHQAVSDYTKAIELNPQYTEAYYGRALARVVLKNLPGALADVERAIVLNRNYAGAYNLRATIHRKQGNIHGAIADFKQAAELYLEQKDQENCRRCLSSLQQLQPKPKTAVVQSVTTKPAPILSAKDYFTQLIEKAEQGDTRQAMEDLNWILKADPQDAKAYCCRGVV